MENEVTIQNPVTPEERISRAMEGDAPKVYLNGFQTGITNSDLFVVCEANNAPVAVVNMSFTTAKTLAIALTDAIQSLERRMEREIATTHELNAKMQSKPDEGST